MNTSSHHRRPPRPALALLAGLLIAAASLALTPPAFAAEQPKIESTSSKVQGTCATLEATINPDAAETTYQFEYLTQERFREDGEQFEAGTERSPQPAVSIGSGETGHKVSSKVCGLAYATPYVFRALAVNSLSPAGGTPGPTETFRAFNGPSHVFISSFGSNTSTPPTPARRRAINTSTTSPTPLTFRDVRQPLPSALPPTTEKSSPPSKLSQRLAAETLSGPSSPMKNATGDPITFTGSLAGPTSNRSRLTPLGLPPGPATSRLPGAGRRREIQRKR